MIYIESNADEQNYRTVERRIREIVRRTMILGFMVTEQTQADAWPSLDIAKGNGMYVHQPGVTKIRFDIQSSY